MNNTPIWDELEPRFRKIMATAEAAPVTEAAQTPRPRPKKPAPTPRSPRARTGAQKAIQPVQAATTGET